MRIAQVAPLYESVPPKLYGGTERVIAYLTDELLALGHEVTLFASGDSQTRAKLVAPCRRSLRSDPNCENAAGHHVLMLERVMQGIDRGEFDVVHFHTDSMHCSMARRHRFAHVTTLHGRPDHPDNIEVYREFLELPFVSISFAQRQCLADLNWIGNVYHGLPARDLTFHPKGGNYLAFLGRISPDKGVDHAIEIAKAVGMPLKIAAKVDRADRAYFESKIEPMLDHPLIEFIGEIGQRDKSRFLGEAYALVFPIRWPEPFGLVMIEAMACGTPVLAYRAGSAPEIIDDGVTGFIVAGFDEALTKIKALGSIDRAGCRRVFEQRFSVRRMALDYLAIYEAARAHADTVVFARGPLGIEWGLHG